MRTKNIFLALALMVAAMLLSAHVASAAPEGPQSVLTYTAPAQLWLDLNTFDCPIASHKFDKATSVGTITFKGVLKTIKLNSRDNLLDKQKQYRGFNNSKITSIVIPEGVTTIGKEAFYGCSNLAKVTLPQSLIIIEEAAFGGCSSLKSIVIPNRVTTIGESAFYYCSGLTSVTIGNKVANIRDDVFEGCNSLTNVTTPEQWINFFAKFANVKIINGKDVIKDGCSIIHGSTIISFDKTITSYTIPNSVTTIGEYAFDDCSSLKSITIPDSVTEIGNGAFAGCSNLTSITIPDSVNEIGGEAFNGCSSLTSITIADSVKEIKGGAFDGCDALKDVNINITDLAKYCTNNAIHKIPGNKHFYIDNKEITELVIPDGVTSIAEKAFFNCKSLKSITIPDSVTSIGWNAFANSAIKSFTISVVTADTSYLSKDLETHKITGYIGKYASADGLCIIKEGVLINYLDKGQAEYAIPENVAIIGRNVFKDCRNLINVTLHSGVTAIENHAFYGCSRLTNITIPDSVTAIGEYAFYDCSSLTSITIPDSVTTIENGAFSGCSSLTSITIPNSVTTIGEYAFDDCSSLTSITIPNGVTTIGEYAFDDCSSLTDVATSERWIDYFMGFANVERINSNDIIRDDYSAVCGEAIIWIDKAVPSFTIPDGVTKIDDRAFAGCDKLESISIPASVKSIAPTAFEGCKKLKNVNVADLNVWLRSGVDMSSCYWWQLYHNGELVTNVVIPNGVKVVALGQFCSCSSLTSITIPDGVTEIGADAFSYCKNLRSVTIPNSVTKIGYSAFEGCSSISSITIPASVTYIGKDAFMRDQEWGTFYIYMKSATPPALDGRFENWYYVVSWGREEERITNDVDVIIYVPKNALFNYRSAAVWKDMADLIHPMD